MPLISKCADLAFADQEKRLHTPLRKQVYSVQERKRGLSPNFDEIGIQKLTGTLRQSGSIVINLSAPSV